ncbi:MAG: hypothetical protein ABWZ17_06365 [Candidatus Binatia bacterium]
MKVEKTIETLTKIWTKLDKVTVKIESSNLPEDHPNIIAAEIHLNNSYQFLRKAIFELEDFIDSGDEDLVPKQLLKPTSQTTKGET